MSNTETLHENAQLALDTIMRKPTTGLPSFIFAVVAIGTGVVFGTYPAWKAANLDPIAALRHV